MTALEKNIRQDIEMQTNDSAKLPSSSTGTSSSKNTKTRIPFLRSLSSPKSTTMLIDYFSPKKSVDSASILKKDDIESAIYNVSDSDVTDVEHDLASSYNPYDKKDEETPEEDLSFPEGGKQAWIAVFGCFCGFVACFGLLNSLGAIETQIQKYQLADESSSTIGWIFSLQLFFTYTSCILSGTYFDRNGFKVPVIIGTVLHVGGLFGAANSTKLWHFILSFAICVGIGNGILMSPLVSAPCHYFNKRRGLATSLSTVGGSIGGAIYPIILRELFNKTHPNDPNYGYCWGVRTLAFMDLFLLSISILLVKERLKPTIPPLPDKTFKTKFDNFVQVYLKNSFDIFAFKDMRYLFCVLGTVMGEVSICSSITYWGTYSISKGVSENNAYIIIMLINVSGILGRWIPGYFSDYVGRFNVAILTLFLLSLVEFVAWLPFGTNLNNMYGISVLYGFFSGSIFSLLPVCCGQISKTEEFGKRYATMYFVVAFATLVSVPISGAIIGGESSHEYQHYIIWCGITAFASGCCFIVSRYFSVGFKLVKF
ncbi:hypothetical protein TBLA_0D00760 [Henningerozyma blattae CBS 6284]|uniref:Major facilitator superfamily (MFS) profile domain-containing protein n=1 Tax=Henningerozyma blattae (strain ATCC 34711 / CBS 6284 / DSM 70876 / NBRC 10599 / NRRL Y-10934 / UCD 77-7) TaxID=1071380 RepID=I2H2I2_HENB6|nr:hypothetical protein TBLA_0D00760 [Tetrapisispora blattae CBS 6284]CCH60584.1 hypothetical protein TBLA_0D00760 [Tetrapisispora blattae CBS 6284]